MLSVNYCAVESNISKYLMRRIENSWFCILGVQDYAFQVVIQAVYQFLQIVENGLCYCHVLHVSKRYIQQLIVDTRQSAIIRLIFGIVTVRLCLVVSILI